MPGRKTPLVTSEYYHIFNRGNNRQPTFTTKKEYDRAMITMRYYEYIRPPVKLSRYLTISEEPRKLIDKRITDSVKGIEIIGFCFMPNHYHILAKQLTDNGIAKMI